MMGWYHGELGWGGWLLMTLAMAAFWALVLYAVLALFRDSEPLADLRTPEQILDERLARGEITPAEHQTRRDALRAQHRETESPWTARMT